MTVGAWAFITIFRHRLASPMKNGHPSGLAEWDEDPTTAAGLAIRSAMSQASPKGHCWSSPAQRYSRASRHYKLYPLIDPSEQSAVGSGLTTGLGSATYHGLRVRAEKRFSHGLQFLASYAYSSNVGDNFVNGFNMYNPSSNRSPLDRDVRHILSISGLGELPKGFKVEFSSAALASRHFPPISGAWT